MVVEKTNTVMFMSALCLFLVGPKLVHKQSTRSYHPSRILNLVFIHPSKFPRSVRVDACTRSGSPDDDDGGEETKKEVAANGGDEMDEVVRPYGMEW
jgi:hypothetical protein